MTSVLSIALGVIVKSSIEIKGNLKITDIFLLLKFTNVTNSNYVTVDVDSRKKHTFKIALKLLLGVIYAKTGKKTQNLSWNYV